MPGVGKTNLLTQINDEFAKTLHNFDVIIWVVVNKDTDTETVQDNIAKEIGIWDESWREKDMDEKASYIHRSLKNKRFVLLLDDIWKRYELSTIGLPPLTKQNKSKLVFTTRSEIVCGVMEAQNIIKVNCLPWKDDCDLFQKTVGVETLYCVPEICDLAQIVVRECGGLPLALIHVGRAMAHKRTPQAWKYAIDVLKNSTAEFSGMSERVFPQLLSSYDSLTSGTVQSCLLYCCLFPEDFEISKEGLIDYLIGEGILYGSIGSRDHGYHLITTLVHECLLEEVGGDRVKMHVIMRAMMLWISREQQKAIDKVLVITNVFIDQVSDFSK